MGWIDYFKQRPQGWKDDHRAAILAQTTYQGKTKLNVNKLFPSLAMIEQNLKSEQGKILTKNDPFIQKFIQVGNKNKIDWLKEEKKD